MSDPFASYVLLCDLCGEPLDTEETVDPRREGLDVLCDTCYEKRNMFWCCWRGEPDDQEVQHRDLAVCDPEVVGLALPGFYRIDRFPYYTDAMLSWWLEDAAMTWLGYLPADAPEGDGYACGHLCEACQQKALEHITYTLRCGVAALV